MKNKRLLLVVASLLIASLACSLFSNTGRSSEETIPSGDENVPGEAPSSGGSAGSGSAEYDTEFPLPADVENITDLGDNGINYQTTMSLNDVVEFYRDAFSSAGYDERDITTVINDTTFSIVWDGHPSGKAIVVQGVDLGNGTFNVNVRFEDV